jgi:hypothetical protein
MMVYLKNNYKYNSIDSFKYVWNVGLWFLAIRLFDQNKLYEFKNAIT